MMRIQLAEVGSTKGTGIGQAVIEDVGIVRYPSGKIFIRYLYSDLLKLLAEDMKRNVDSHYDNVIAVVGAEGSGKSNLAWQICHAYDEYFDVKKQYVYSAEDFREKLREGAALGSTFWMDEGSNIANNRDWQSVSSKDFIQILEMMRSRGWTLVFCIPSFERLDVYIREHRIRYLIECKPMQFGKDDYEKARGYYELKKKAIKGFTTVGYGRFDPMPEDVKEVYEAIKLDAQQKKIEEVTTRDDSPGSKYKRMYEDKTREADDIMLALYESKTCDKDGLMQLYGIDSEKTFHNRISKARKRRDNHGQD